MPRVMEQELHGFHGFHGEPTRSHPHPTALGMQPLTAKARHTLCWVSLGTKSLEAFVYPLPSPAVV